MTSATLPLRSNVFILRFLSERRSRRKHDSSQSRTPWDLVGLLVLAGMVAAFHVGKAPPALPSIRADLGASLGQAGWLLSIVNLVTACGGMAIALTADRLGHRRLILFGTAVALLTSLMRRRCRRRPMLLLGLRVVEGLGFICVVVAIPPLLVRIARRATSASLLPPGRPTCRRAPA